MPGTVTKESSPGQWKSQYNGEIVERNKFTAPLAGYMFATFGVVVGGAAALEMIPFMSPYVFQGARAYATTYGAKGGINVLWNWGIQTGQTGSANPLNHNLFGYVASAFTGPSIYSQSFIGGAGGLINFTPKKGLSGAWNRPLGITTLDVIIGFSAPIYSIGGPVIGAIGGSTQLIVGGRSSSYLEENYPLK